jgi:spore germination protein KA
MKPLMLDARKAEYSFLNDKGDLFTLIKENVLTVGELEEIRTFGEIIDGMLSGNTLFLINGYSRAIKVCTVGHESRGVQEPETEAVVRGPREGFNEDLRTNTSLLRRKLKSPDLVFKKMVIGRLTKTDICIVYIRGIANNKIVEELRRRLKRINIDGIIESGYIEELIEDNPLSIFPLIGNTEKPDIAAAKLLEGRVAIITDGTPIVLTLPYLFVESIQNSEDYYSGKWLYSTMIRWLRILALLITISLPALYIAIKSYHQEMIPTLLFLTMAAAKEGIPFPVFVESLLMIISFEVLKEAGVRLPRPIGQAVSIVGALVLGEASVQAGIVSAPTIIIIALAGITGFIIPTQNASISIIRLIFMILAGFAGLFGLFIGIVLLLIHMVSLRSFGVPYLSSLAPSTISDLKDVLIRAPLWAQQIRPRLIGWKDLVKLGSDQMPEPPQDEEEKIDEHYDKDSD